MINIALVLARGFLYSQETIDVLTIINRVETYYNNAFNKLIIVISVGFAIVGIIIPIVVSRIQTKKAEDLFNKLNNDFIESHTKLTNEFNDNNKKLRDMFLQTETSFKMEIKNANEETNHSIADSLSFMSKQMGDICSGIDKFEDSLFYYQISLIYQIKYNDSYEIISVVKKIISIIEGVTKGVIKKHVDKEALIVAIKSTIKNLKEIADNKYDQYLFKFEELEKNLP